MLLVNRFAKFSLVVIYRTYASSLLHKEAQKLSLYNLFFFFFWGGGGYIVSFHRCVLQENEI